MNYEKTKGNVPRSQVDATDIRSEGNPGKWKSRAVWMRTCLELLRMEDRKKKLSRKKVSVIFLYKGANKCGRSWR